MFWLKISSFTNFRAIGEPTVGDCTCTNFRSFIIDRTLESEYCNNEHNADYFICQSDYNEKGKEKCNLFCSYSNRNVFVLVKLNWVWSLPIITPMLFSGVICKLPNKTSILRCCFIHLRLIWLYLIRNHMLEFVCGLWDKRTYSHYVFLPSTFLLLLLSHLMFKCLNWTNNYVLWTPKKKYRKGLKENICVWFFRIWTFECISANHINFIENFIIHM
jgi:hypothetical protein